jgi:hypothetical protein
MKLNHILMFSLLAVGTGCTWVKLTPGGEAVTVADETSISDCTKVGNVTANTKEKVVTSRNQKKVDEELRMLARNEAANLGADTIVPFTEETDGAQTFNAYRCQ